MARHGMKATGVPDRTVVSRSNLQKTVEGRPFDYGRRVYVKSSTERPRQIQESVAERHITISATYYLGKKGTH